MAMTKKEKAAMQAAIDKAETLAALRWTAPVERDVPIPDDGYSEGWDQNAYLCSVWKAWSSSVNHGEGDMPVAGVSRRLCQQNGRRLYSTKAKALAAMRHEVEQKAAADLLSIDRKIADALQEAKES